MRFYGMILGAVMYWKIMGDGEMEYYCIIYSVPVVIALAIFAQLI